MKKSIFLSLIFSGLLIAGALLFAPVHRVFAERLVIDVVKAPDQLVTCGLVGSPTFCDMCDLIVLVKAVLDFIWTSAWVVAAGMMVYGGFYMILPSFGAGGSGMYEKGNKILWNVAKGLVIVFFAWVAIDTIIKVVAGGVDNSLTSGVPAVLPQVPDSPFTSVATQDEESVQRVAKIKLGPWNKISCTRAPERAPLALLQIPEEFQCVNGKPVKPIQGFNPCDPLVAQNIQAWQNGNAESFAGTPVGVVGQCKPGILNGAEGNYNQIIIQEAANNGVPLDCAQASFIVESDGKRNAFSPKGAAGLGQIMPATAKDLDRPRFGNKSPEEIQAELKANPQLSIQLSMKYLGNIMKKEARGDCVLATAGYNAGPQNIYPSPKGTCNGQPAWMCITETVNHVKKIQANISAINSGCNPG